MIGSTARRHFASTSSLPAIRFGFSQSWKSSTLEPQFHLAEWEKVTKGLGPVSREFGVAVVFVAANKCRTKRNAWLRKLSWCILARVVSPTLWRFAPEFFFLLPRKFAIEFSVHRLSWWNKFLKHEAFNVLTVIGHGSEIVLPSSFARSWSLPLRWKLFLLRVIWCPNN